MSETPALLSPERLEEIRKRFDVRVCLPNPWGTLHPRDVTALLAHSTAQQETLRQLRNGLNAIMVDQSQRVTSESTDWGAEYNWLMGRIVNLVLPETPTPCSVPRGTLHSPATSRTE